MVVGSSCRCIARSGVHCGDLPDCGAGDGFWFLSRSLLIALLPVLGLAIFDFEEYFDGRRSLHVSAHTRNRHAFFRCADPRSRHGPVAMAGGALLLLAVLAFNQVGMWQDTDALIRRQLAFDPDSSTGPQHSGQLLVALERYDEAAKEFRTTISDLNARTKSARHFLAILRQSSLAQRTD